VVPGREKRVHIVPPLQSADAPIEEEKQRDKRALVLCFALLLAIPSSSSSSSSTSAKFAECCKWTGREKAAVHLVSCRQYCGEL